MAEVHRIRREIYARFDGDMAAYFRYLRAQEEEERKRGRVIVDRSQRSGIETDAA
ncbi:MAG TPA: hypothetical protein VEQ60_11890 [Longimicrobium sp.]|nr:hypothetical protein [Longimicrobium sp.]